MERSDFYKSFEPSEEAAVDLEMVDYLIDKVGCSRHQAVAANAVAKKHFFRAARDFVDDMDKQLHQDDVAAMMAIALYIGAMTKWCKSREHIAYMAFKAAEMFSKAGGK